MTGAAIRAATALGMNMRNDSEKLKDSLKEMRYRVWWSLYSLEHRLCSLTGRVNCIVDEHCTTPLPVPLEEEKFDTEEGIKLLSKERQQGDRNPMSNSHSPSLPTTNTTTPSTERSNSGSKTADQSRSPPTLNASQGELDWAKDIPPNSSLFFLHLVQLTRLTQNVFQQLYNPTANFENTWSDIQSTIKDLNAQLDVWYRKLPLIFEFRRKQRDREFYEFRLSLGFFYYGTKMMVFRPCLCRLERKIPNQSNKSYDFNRNSAQSCVEAAQDMLRLIPDEPNAVGLIRVGPWYSILHWIVQAASVLMLEISFRVSHMPEEADSILESSKKAVRWLHALGEDNLAGARAWRLTNEMLHQAVRKIGRDVNDLPDKCIRRSGSEVQSDVSGVTQTQTQAIPNDRLQPANFPSFTGTSQGAFQAYANYDQMMRYDQYFPVETSMRDYQPSSTVADYQPTTDAEMEFMSSAFHDDHDHPLEGSVGSQYHG